MTPAIQTILRYRSWHSLPFYVAGKLALDPAYPALRQAISNSSHPVLDLGCGIGLLAAYLRDGGFDARIIGLDADPQKVAIAQRALTNGNAHFEIGDARNLPSHTGNVVLLDVLHYFPTAERTELLRRVISSIAPGGAVFVRVTLNEPTWRFAMTRAEEWIIQRSGWIRLEGWHFPTREEVCAPFRDASFSIECRPMWGWTPFNGYFFVFRRPASPAGFPVPGT